MSARRASPSSNMASTHSYLPPPSLQSTKLLSLHSLQFEYNHWIRQPSGYNGCVDTSRTYKYNPVDVLWMLCGLQSPFSFVQGQNVCCTPELCCKCDRRPAEKPKPTVDLFKELQFLRGYNLRVILSPGSRGATCLPES